MLNRPVPVRAFGRPRRPRRAGQTLTPRGHGLVLAALAVLIFLAVLTGGGAA